MLMAKKTTKVSTKRVKRAFEVVLDSVVIGTFKKENIPTRVVKIARVHRSGFKELDYLFVVKKSTNDSTSNNAGDLNDGKHYYRLSFK